MENAPTIGSSSPAPVPFDRQASRDLEQIGLASEHLRDAWRALTPVGNRRTFACGLVLEIAAMLGDLASEERRIESEARI